MNKVTGYSNAQEIANQLNKVGKYDTFDLPRTSLNVDEEEFKRNTIVTYTGGAGISILKVDNLKYEVVFDIKAGVTFSVPLGTPTIGEADINKRRFYSFLNGTLVIGNFE